MAILFDWYELPEPKDKQREEKILHPSIRLNGSTTTDELRRRIQERSSLTETDVSAVLDALSHVMGEDLAEGRQVHLDGIGYFHPVLTSTEPVTAATKRKTTKIKLKGIKFRADQVLKNEIGAIKVKSVGSVFLHSRACLRYEAGEYEAAQWNASSRREPENSRA